MGSTLATCALYLLAELVERAREVESVPPIDADETDHLPFHLEQEERTGDDAEAPIGVPIPAATAFLGVGFVACALMIAGLPPFAGFLAKFAMLTAAFGRSGTGQVAQTAIAGSHWALLALLLGSGLLSMIALSRAGVRHFWAPQGRPVPRLRVVEGAPIAALLVACAVLTVRADAAVRYAQATAYGVLDPARYIDAVMSATPAPAPVRSSVAGHAGR
jgi:multicomponent K+:H+ antiporter subunit D